MPIYEYRCDNCGHELESIQKVSDALLTTCPECEKDTLVKKISAAGFRLKGGGWYETDFKSGQKKNLSGSDGDAKSGGDKGDKKATGAKDGGSTSTSSSDSGSSSSKAEKKSESSGKPDKAGAS